MNIITNSQSDDKLPYEPLSEEEDKIAKENIEKIWECYKNIVPGMGSLLYEVFKDINKK